MIQLTDNIYAVEVPSMAFGIMTNNYGDESELMYMLSMEDISDEPNHEETLITKKLSPPGFWQFLFTTREVTEEQARLIVKTEMGGFTGNVKGFKDYEIVGCDISPLLTALLSFQSLLRSKGCDINQNLAIIQKQNDNGTEQTSVL